MRTLWEVGLEKEGDSCQLGVEEKELREQGLGDYPGRACMAGSGSGGEEVARAVTPGAKLQRQPGDPPAGRPGRLSTRKNV